VGAAEIRIDAAVSVDHDEVRGNVRLLGGAECAALGLAFGR
jgi:hypothetical protein